MTKPAILETLARAIHCHDGRLPTPWDADMIARWPDDCEYERKEAESQAAAAMELPEVRALVDAATALLVQVDGLIPIKHPQQKLERNKLRHAITAIAAWEKQNG